MINLEKEIREQPAVLAGVAAANMDTIRALVAEVRAADVASVQLAARGTSDHAAIYAQYLIHTIVGIPCGLSTPSVVSKYHGKLSFERTLVIGISQSGRAADALAVVERANQTGAVTVAVTRCLRLRNPQNIIYTAMPDPKPALRRPRPLPLR